MSLVYMDGPRSTLGVRLSEMKINVKYCKVDYKKFPDGSDNIFVHGFQDRNYIANSDIIFCMSMEDNESIMQSFHVLSMLTESFINSLTIVIPFMRCGTMERVEEEGQVATANTFAKMMSHLSPQCSVKNRVVTVDLHTLHNRFYFGRYSAADLCSVVPDVVDSICKNRPHMHIVFPDAGASKRYKKMLLKLPQFNDDKICYCNKVRNGLERVVTLDRDIDCVGKHFLIVDDLVRTGGTLVSCARQLKQLGAASVEAFCVHTPTTSQNLHKMKQTGVIDKLHVTNTVEKLIDGRGYTLDSTWLFRYDVVECIDDFLFRTTYRSNAMVVDSFAARKAASTSNVRKVPVVLCSTSAVKDLAVRLATSVHIGTSSSTQMNLVQCDSGVAKQPVGMDQIRLGASNRMRQGKKFAKDKKLTKGVIVSIESGVTKMNGPVFFDIACVQVYSIGSQKHVELFTQAIPIPQSISAQLDEDLLKDGKARNFGQSFPNKKDPHSSICGIPRSHFICDTMQTALNYLKIRHEFDSDL